MKKIILLVLIALSSRDITFAQSFVTQYDTISRTPIGSTVIINGITATTGTVVIQWRITECNFPSSWIPATGICDNNLCYPLSTLVPSGVTKTSSPYSTTMGDFHMLIDLTDVSDTGCYYLRVQMNNQSVPADVAFETYIICKPTQTATANVTALSDKIIVFPNPATNKIEVVYDNANIERFAIYSIGGEFIYRDNLVSSPFTFDIGNIPHGLYFVRFIDKAGKTVAVKQFTKQ